MSLLFRIVVCGELPLAWSAVFGSMQAASQPDGTTVLTGTLPDQAALYGLLVSLRDWGLPLVAVTLVAQEGKESGALRP